MAQLAAGPGRQLSVDVDQLGLTYTADSVKHLGDEVVSRSAVLAQCVASQSSHLRLPCSTEAFERWVSFESAFSTLQHEPDPHIAADLFQVCAQSWAHQALRVLARGTAKASVKFVSCRRIARCVGLSTCCGGSRGCSMLCMHRIPVTSNSVQAPAHPLLGLMMQCELCTALLGACGLVCTAA